MKYYSITPDSRLITKAILSAYDNADFLEKQAMNKLTDPLMNAVKGLTREGALELVGKVGIAELLKPTGAMGRNNGQ